MLDKVHLSLSSYRWEENLINVCWTNETGQIYNEKWQIYNEKWKIKRAKRNFKQPNQKTSNLPSPTLRGMHLAEIER